MSTGDDNGSPSTAQAPAPAGGRRRILIGAAAFLAVLVAVALVLVLGPDDADTGNRADGEPRTSDAAATPGETVAPPPPTPEPTGPTEEAATLPVALPEVALDAPAEVGNGIVARIAQLEAIDGSAVGPGNIAGPALRVTVRIENGTGEVVSLDGVAVNASYGTAKTPASPLEDRSQRPFAGMLAPGGTADGVYVFSVPSDARSSVTLEVGYQAGAPLLLFTGSAP